MSSMIQVKLTCVKCLQFEHRALILRRNLPSASCILHIPAHSRKYLHDWNTIFPVLSSLECGNESHVTIMNTFYSTWVASVLIIHVMSKWRRFASVMHLSGHFIFCLACLIYWNLVRFISGHIKVMGRKKLFSSELCIYCKQHYNDIKVS